MKISELPEDIKKIALQRQQEQGIEFNEDTDIYNGNYSFDWMETPEGWDIWRSVYTGDFQSFYDFHKIEKPFEYGEEVEVRHQDSDEWQKRRFVGINTVDERLKYIVVSKTGYPSGREQCRRSQTSFYDKKLKDLQKQAEKK